jgi:hypothetical protein
MFLFYANDLLFEPELPRACDYTIASWVVSSVEDVRHVPVEKGSKDMIGPWRAQAQGRQSPNF